MHIVNLAMIVGCVCLSFVKIPIVCQALFCILFLSPHLPFGTLFLSPPPNHQYMDRIRPHLTSFHSLTLHTQITCLCMHLAPCGKREMGERRWPGWFGWPYHLWPRLKQMQTKLGAPAHLHFPPVPSPIPLDPLPSCLDHGHHKETTATSLLSAARAH
jgi:hypothetical protein